MNGDDDDETGEDHMALSLIIAACFLLKFPPLACDLLVKTCPNLPARTYLRTYWYQEKQKDSQPAMKN